MIAVDTNLLVHAHQRETSLHEKAKSPDHLSPGSRERSVELGSGTIVLGEM
jgi:hypothetical protein